MPISQGLPQNEDQSEENVARIIYTPANHFSRRTLFDDKKALWGSWVVIGSEGSKFWFGGDTAYSDVFKQIGKRYGPFDIAAIPIGMILRAQLFTSLKADLCQDINEGFALIKCLNGTFP